MVKYKQYIFMHINQDSKLPKSGETLAEYVRRMRTALGMSQAELAQRAGMHLQSVGKIELVRQPGLIPSP